MRILFLTNLYPPHFIGGYEQLCKDVADGLAAKGHDCHVLTSTYGIGRQSTEGNVYRLLALEGDFAGNRPSLAASNRIRLDNERTLLKVIGEVDPDLIFIWSMRRFSRSLLFLLEGLGRRVVYYVTDNWLLDHYRPTRQNLKKYLLSLGCLFKRPSLDNVICSSNHMKQELIERGIPLQKAHVVYNGVDLAPYLDIQRERKHDVTRILYAGRLVSEKGPHTLLQAFIDLPVEQRRDLQLTIVGGGEEAYIRGLQGMARQAGVEKAVYFTGNVSREELPGYFASHDIFVFPSIWQEPFSLTLIMALASEIPVIGTLNGGSKEILRDRENSLAFTAGDSTNLVEKLQTLLDDQALGRALARQGRADSLSCTLPAMVGKVEKILEEVARGR